MDINYLASCLEPIARIAMGRMMRSTAFSWTCQPNRKDDQAHNTRHLRNWVTLCGESHSLTKAGTMVSRVMTAVTGGKC